MNRVKRWLRSLGHWLLANVHPKADEVDTIVQKVFAECGLNAEQYEEHFDLQASGKLHEVLIHSARQLGMNLRTVGDVKFLLR